MRTVGFLAVLTILAVARPALGRDDHLMLPIKDALASPDAEKLDPGVKLYFGHAKPAVAKSLGTFTTNQKANGFGKEDKVACERAFISAMIAPQRNGDIPPARFQAYHPSNSAATTAAVSQRGSSRSCTATVSVAAAEPAMVTKGRGEFRI